MSLAQRISLAAFLTCLLPALVLAFSQRQREEFVQRQPYGRYTERQVIEKCLPILIAVMPKCNGLRVSASQESTRLSNGQDRHFWYVDGSDTAGDSRTDLIIDTDTGQVVRISRTLPQRQPFFLPPQKVLQSARRWMVILGYADDWQLRESPCHIGKMWFITLHGPGYQADLKIEGPAGTLIDALVSASHTPRPDTQQLH